MSSVNIFPQVDTAQISSYEPNKVFGSCKDMYLGRKDINTRFRMLFKFPITSIPDECMILKAVLRIYVQFAGMLIPSFFTPYALKEDWHKQTVTWNNQPFFHPNVSGDTTIIKRVDCHYFNITKMVAKWYEHEIMNYGLIIKNEELLDGTCKRVNTVLNSDLAPRVEITYAQKSKINIVPTRFVSGIEVMDTDELYSFSSTINTSLTTTITCHIENLENKPVEVKYQMSPNGIDFVDDCSSPRITPANGMILFVPCSFAKYGRIAARNVHSGETSKIKIWYQAQE
ncbi:DNRLRE domain-containing protein [Marinisporobacter balticus]|uniref:TGF-beta propeptide n=1 Tax=Marinisporobacter balticus TaxID=2018667 RepID=A0A4R2KID7_9FIRM|nr:DNRLRE domain-containing protein [Marinisporobacter balticus]TCO73631.1 hypothetical protein EV214_11520 [Marinisporobacter balticus]